jgi:DNA-binding transcriptional LysR family regulator
MMAPHSLRDITLFVAAYEERSFTAAAQRENSTQSGVSQHVKKLEDHLGVPLFIRTTGTITPTPASDIYYRYCLDVLRASNRAISAVSAFAGGHDGEFAVGLMPTMTRATLTPVLTRFSARHPSAKVRITEGYSTPLTESVLSGDLDFAIVPAAGAMTGLTGRSLLKTPEVVISRAGSNFGHLKMISLADHAPIKLVLPNSPNTRRTSIETYLDMNEIHVERIMELDSMMGSLDFVMQTDWMSIVPSIMMANEILGQDTQQFNISGLAGRPFLTELIVIERARDALSPAALAFLEMLEDAASELNDRIIRCFADAEFSTREVVPATVDA